MKSLKDASQKYFDLLKERAAQSRVYKPHQLTGLTLAELLKDNSHKTLYMKLAKEYNNDELLRLAKNIAERKSVASKGAYFMKVFKSSGIKKL